MYEAMVRHPSGVTGEPENRKSRGKKALPLLQHYSDRQTDKSS
jgi:hypothetical protein